MTLLQRYLKDTFSINRFGGYETKNMSELRNSQLDWNYQELSQRYSNVLDNSKSVCLLVPSVWFYLSSFCCSLVLQLWFNLLQYPTTFCLFYQKIDHTTRYIALDSWKITNQVLHLKTWALEPGGQDLWIHLRTLLFSVKEYDGQALCFCYMLKLLSFHSFHLAVVSPT